MVKDNDAMRDALAILNDGDFGYIQTGTNTLMVQNDEAQEISEILEESNLPNEIRW